jgi:glutamate racemase
VEAGQTSGDEVLSVAREYLAPLIAENVDTLVLGCTHYPFLRGAISYVMGENVRLVSSDNETAKDVYRELVNGQLDRGTGAAPVFRYEATGEDTPEFMRLARQLLGPHIETVEQVYTGRLDLPLEN